MNNWSYKKKSSIKQLENKTKSLLNKLQCHHKIKEKNMVMLASWCILMHIILTKSNLLTVSYQKNNCVCNILLLFIIMPTHTSHLHMIHFACSKHMITCTEEAAMNTYMITSIQGKALASQSLHLSQSFTFFFSSVPCHSTIHLSAFFSLANSTTIEMPIQLSGGTYPPSPLLFTWPIFYLGMNHTHPILVKRNY